MPPTSESETLPEAQASEITTAYREHLEAAIEHYNLEDTAFCNDRTAIIDKAIELVAAYEIEPGFLSVSEASLMYLALSDEWLSTQNQRERQQLLDVLKVVSIGVRDEGPVQTFSGKVRNFSEARAYNARKFDPQAIPTSDYALHDFERFIAADTYQDGTARLRTMVDTWNATSRFFGIREKLNMIAATERPFDVVVVNESDVGLSQRFGRAACVLRRPSANPLIVLSYTHDQHQLEHEYLHTQFDRIAFGYGYGFLSGIEEAAVDRLAVKPAFSGSGYERQMQTLGTLFAQNSQLETVVYAALRDGSRRDELFSYISNNYGLRGFLLLARMDPGAAKRIYGDFPGAYIDPEVVQRRIDQLLS